MLKYICDVNRLESGNLSLSQVVSSFSSHATLSLSEDLLLTQRMTIADLMEVGETCLCSVMAKVIEVDADNGWYYQSCSKCFKKVKRFENKLYCDKCTRFVIAIPRYEKLLVSVADIFE